MIYIRPDYSFLHKCHYCQKNIATNGKEVSQTMYRVVKSKTFPVGYSYIKAKIDIPRCETCARKQNIVDSIGFIIFVIISVCVGLFLYENDNEWFTGFWHILFGNSAKRIYLSEIKRVRRITPFSGNELATVLIAVVCIALLV